MAEEPDWKVLPLDRCSSILIASPLKTTPPKLEREVTMTMEVRGLLSQAMLDMSGHVSGNSTPKRPNPVVVLTPPPHKLRDLSRPVDTSSHVSAPNNVEMAKASQEEVLTTILSHSHDSRVQEPHPSCRHEPTLREGQQIPRRAAGHKSINACRQKVVWELGMELHWNNSETAESIKEARGICTHATLMLRPSAP